jgi:ADP-ribosylglycohydrolase
MNTALRLELARKSLIGVSIGDAFGESFFGDTDSIQDCIASGTIPKTSWEFTDDTVMSIAVFEELEKDGEIDQERLIKKICINHDKDPNRGYGATVRRVIREINEGGDWKQVAAAVFDGQGSMGNGASMRVCPIGAYHFDDLEKVKTLAEKSALVTHANAEGVAGAIAVAIATALATRLRKEHQKMEPLVFIDAVIREMNGSDTRSKIAKSMNLPYSYHIETIRNVLGNGVNMTSQDTVPFVIWCAAHNLQDFRAGLWKAVSILGDRDTICAMVGGILILSAPEPTVPEDWKNNVEKVEKSIFRS